MNLILKWPKYSFFILRKRQKTFSFQVNFIILSNELKALLLVMVDIIFQLGLVSQADNHCQLYQKVMTEWT